MFQIAECLLIKYIVYKLVNEMSRIAEYILNTCTCLWLAARDINMNYNLCYLLVGAFRDPRHQIFYSQILLSCRLSSGQQLCTVKWKTCHFECCGHNYIGKTYEPRNERARLNRMNAVKECLTFSFQPVFLNRDHFLKERICSSRSIFLSLGDPILEVLIVR